MIRTATSPTKSTSAPTRSSSTFASSCRSSKSKIAPSWRTRRPAKAGSKANPIKRLLDPIGYVNSPGWGVNSSHGIVACWESRASLRSSLTRDGGDEKWADTFGPRQPWLQDIVPQQSWPCFWRQLCWFQRRRLSRSWRYWIRASSAQPAIGLLGSRPRSRTSRTRASLYMCLCSRWSCGRERTREPA